MATTKTYELNDSLVGTLRVPVLRKDLRGTTGPVIVAATKTNSLSRAAAELALSTANATYWTAAVLARQTYNDLLHAVRLLNDPLNLNVRQV
jgi:hypothetical protein